MCLDVFICLALSACALKHKRHFPNILARDRDRLTTFWASFVISNLVTNYSVTQPLDQLFSTVWAVCVLKSVTTDISEI